MKQRKFFTWMMCCMLLVSSFSLLGCDDDDNDDTVAASLLGIWQSTEAGVSEETVSIQEDGVYESVFVDFEWETCENYTGTWNANGGDLYITIDVMGEEFTDQSSYQINGDELTLTWDFGEGNVTTSTFVRVNAMPTCEDYGF